MKNFRLILYGCLIGITNGLIGGGGGIVAVAVLTHILAFDQHKAHATAILIILPITIASSIVYIIIGTVNWLLLLIVTVGVITGGIVGAKLFAKIKSQTVKSVFDIVILLSGLRLLLSDVIGKNMVLNVVSNLNIIGIVFLVISGLCAGVLGGMGMGGGLLLIPLLSFTDINQHTIQAINLLSFVPMAFAALYVHSKSGLLQFDKQVLTLIIPAFILAVISAYIIRYIDSHILRVIGGVVLCYFSAMQIFDKKLKK